MQSVISIDHGARRPPPFVPWFIGTKQSMKIHRLSRSTALHFFLCDYVFLDLKHFHVSLYT